MTETHTYIDIHILQTVPPSNLNRDDAGSPKQAIYGGARRARVSSQAWKRATRKAFTEDLDYSPSQLGTRTKRVSTLLAKRLAAQTSLDDEAATRLSNALLAHDLDIKPGKKDTETAYLLFVGRNQLDAIVDLVADRAAELTALPDDALAKAVADLPVRAQLTVKHPIDVALFGRMVADIPTLNVDAATQVAHALSVHPVEIEFDYYTAVDDEKKPDEDAGAAMIGTVEFTSATLYRFATLDVQQLAGNLDQDLEATVEAARAFLHAFVTAMPTGHQNSFAHRTIPSLVSYVVRTNQPVNLVTAFEKPIRSRDGIAAAATTRLATEVDRTSNAWGLTPLAVASVYDPALADASTIARAFGESRSLADAIDATTATVRTRLTGTSTTR
ncbi:type I-E CRISPR-associated protein Cas7/Cse4/CasC [Micromonospora sp. HM134]|uniref:type I-E CRISPR-associated protein Cas7/Cse4/CasC n=1 Tax=Micromonospora sp. HM134 TaxID=2583243 RepID=UPI0011987751|nr:type I-E CRISPR-associated protein Cas7/Cse4/CasC [Micromonospora sp. HM134]QDY09428.1 type I-E CRISPR-associated protein Cas7/Cse4/CasC [Micromonospora sp. HM134]